MMTTLFTKLLKALLYCSILGIALLALLFAVLQSKWGRSQVQKSLIGLIHSKHVEASISEVQGRLPFSWKIATIELKHKDVYSLKLEDITLRLSILPLFKGRFEVGYVHIQQGSFTRFSSDKQSLPWDWEKAQKELRSKLRSLTLSTAINLNSIAIDQLTIAGPYLQEPTLIGIRGLLKIRPHFNELALQLRIFSPETHKTHFETSVHANKKLNWIEMTSKVHLSELPSTLPCQAEMISHLSLKGHWSTWRALLYNKPTQDQVKGKLQSSFVDTRFASNPFLEGDSSIKSTFSLDSLSSLKINSLELLSDYLHLSAQGTLYTDLKKSKLNATFSLPQLPSFSPLQLNGSFTGKAEYNQGAFELSFEGSHVQIDEIKAPTLLGSASGTLLKSQVDALIHLSSESATIPFHAKCELHYTPYFLSINKLDLHSEEDKLTGSFSYPFDQNSYKGTLSLQVEEINRFEPLLRGMRLYGGIHANAAFTSFDNILQSDLSLTGDHMLYEDVLIDDLSLHLLVDDLWNTPQGEIYCLAEKVYTEGLYLESLLIESSASSENPWPFSITLAGRTDEPLYLECQGSWLKTQQDFTLQLFDLSGYSSQTTFKLKSPTTLLIEEDKQSLSALDLSLGGGHLHADFSIDPTQADMHLNVKHFPLDLLRPFHPQVGLKGFMTAQGFLKADADKLQGHLIATLEKASLSSPEKPEALQAKGTLQAHLEQDRSQVHLLLKASDKQFFDWMVSFPVTHTLHPFSLKWDLDKPNSSELTAEGNLEHLFDFINLGSNHFSGRLSSRLFLSGSLNHPQLLGKLEWEKGTYENDFTGLRLKNINALAEAEKEQINLTSLQATDDRSGAVSMTGALDLNWQENFPYRFVANMHELHSVEFDLIDSTLSGPLHLSGDRTKLLTKGSLLVDKAMIHIGERLPYEIPHMPFTYIHKPLNLDSKALARPPRFNFHLDLELKTAGPVKAEGKGLHADLTGHLHLQGVNRQIHTDGQLDLEKGEYIFAGKVFKLTEGSILFKDKPTPKAHINVSGTLQLQAMIITVNLIGPLTSPQLTFHSNPQSSTSSILAHILFDKDISEINQMESLQLAGTLISLSGGAGPDILESIRKTIGVDRLNISSKGSTNEVAVQIGKYLTKGVMITLSQTPTSSQVIVEVELPKGFVFQAETQEQEEGKFSLKWRKSY